MDRQPATRILLPEVWLLIADRMKRPEFGAVSRSSRWLRQMVLGHHNEYMPVMLPEAAPTLLETRLTDALNHADTAGRRVGIVAPPTAIGNNLALGTTVLTRLNGSSSQIVWLQITLPLSFAPQFRNLVRAMDAARLKALHVSFLLVGGVNNGTPPPLDFSGLLSSAPNDLETLSIVSEYQLVTLPTQLVGLQNLQYLQLSGRGANGGWPADWRAAVSALATYVPTINVRLGNVEVTNVDLSPLLRGLGAGPLVVAFPDTCVAPGHVMVSTLDGSVVRRLRWGWGDATPGLTRLIYAQLAPVAAQIELAHVDSAGLEMDEPLDTRPSLPALRQMVVHAIMGPFDTGDNVDLDTETPAERAARLDAGGPEYKFMLARCADEFFPLGHGVQVDFWCEHCGNPDTIPEDVRARATATPGPA